MPPLSALSLSVLGVIVLSTAVGDAHSASVLTRNYDNQRSGANLEETILNTSNVNAAQFGKLFSLAVDDQIYSGLLYVPSVQIAGVAHNVIYAATSNNSVYAFDADTAGPPLWKDNFNGSGRPTRNSEVGSIKGTYTDFRGNIGIVGTPVIDGTRGTLYFVTRTVEAGGTVQRLRAVDITTGNDVAHSPQVIQASVPGTGDGGINVVFNAAKQNQRAALALSQGVVYIAWASYGDASPYHGWVMAYDAATLEQVGVFIVTPYGTQGGIWMAGAGPAFDASGNLYFATGNGTADGIRSFSESLVKLARSSLTLLDFYTASNYNTLNGGDIDFGSSGPTMLPGTNMLVTGGKEGRLYLLNTNDLGKLAAGDVQIPQVFQAVDPTVRPTASHHIHNSSPAWNSPQGTNVYVWGENDYLHGYRYNRSTNSIGTSPFATGALLAPWGMPGGVMSLSANESQTGTGIVWGATPRNGDANQNTVAGTFAAFDAETLALLWQSTGQGDDVYNISKGSPPMVVNGKAYLAGLSRFISVFGLRQSPPPSPNLALNKLATGSASCSSSEGPAQAFNGSYSLGYGDKWCSRVDDAFLQVDLGTPTMVNRFLIEHAGAGQEALSLNSVAFNIQVSTDGATYQTVVVVTGNSDSITTHDITPTLARYVRLNVTTPTSTGDLSARIYDMQVFSTPDFTLSATPGTYSVVAGNVADYVAAITPTPTFTGRVAMTVSGLPTGAVANIPLPVGPGNAAVRIATTNATPAGTFPIVISGTSGGLKHSVTVNLTVSATAGTIPTPVSLASSYNLTGIYTDGKKFTGGADGDGFAFSASLLGASQTVNDLAFNLGPPNAPNIVVNTTTSLPSGRFSTLHMLATAVNGNQRVQRLTVTYTDGTASSFTQSLSDWAVVTTYSGQNVAITMPYRNAYNGTANGGSFHGYIYSFALDPAKTLRSLTLPNNPKVLVLAITLTP